MKFCSNCGTQLEDSVKFCSACGFRQPDNAVQQNEPVPSDMPKYTSPYSSSAPAANNSTYSAPVNNTPSENTAVAKAKGFIQGKIWLIPVAAVAVIFLVWFTVFFFRSVVGSGSLTMNGAVKAYYEAYEAKDGKKLVDATLSNSMLKALKESEDMTKKEIIEEYDDIFDTYSSSYQFKFKNIKITDKEKYDRSDIKDLIEDIEDETDVRVSIQKAYEVEVSFKQWNNYTEEWTKTDATLVVYKSAGNWYVLSAFPK